MQQENGKRCNGPTVCGESKNRPGETRRRRQGWSNSFQILNAALYNRVLHSIIQGEECNCRVVSVRCEGSSIDDSVPGVPSATGQARSKSIWTPQSTRKRRVLNHRKRTVLV